ncbi:hypothetical protein DESC_40124 [Desulfosarcina cetonica]|uniref:hypothetical protein n=1 Tax=Desulfosarcina cetonica TaxID=90730 RepID=UPI0006D268CF|nr:hypothetical protein [Desulfosarcina cetonica]VTR66093.1 hypothetical protein DESC_40124 [Desulfosarcina cetonica]
MGKRKKKWPKGLKPKLHQGGVLNESDKLSIDDVIPKIELAGRTFTTRLVDRNDPYNLRRKY